MAQQAKVIPLTPPRTMEMTPSEWSLIPANPRQRDTERHLRKAKHLLTPNPTHARVAMAVSPKGERWKIDGHTRSLAWDRNMVQPPPILYVDAYPVRDAAAAAELYRCFDAKEAVETAGDQVSGAYREHGFVPQSKLFASGILANSIRLADGLSRGNRQATRPSEASVYRVFGDWINEVRALDELNVNKRRFPGPIVTAALLSFRKRGKNARDFWRLFSEDAGEKLAGAIDPVEALSRFMLENRVVGGPVEMVGKALAAFEAHEEHRTITRNLQAIDPSRYLVRAKRT
jgi:hypothetical protein